MAIPRHRGWHLEDFIKQNIHQDANVLDVGGDNAIKIKLILQHKGLRLRRKTGAPTIKVGGELHLFADKSQDLVVLDRVPNIDDEALLKEATRICRKHVLIQTYVEYFGGLESWLEKLNPLGQHLVTFLPLHTSDDLATPDNPPVLIVLDVSQAGIEAEPTKPELEQSLAAHDAADASYAAIYDAATATPPVVLEFEESVGRLVAGFDDDVRAYLARGFGVLELPPFNETMSYDEYGWVLLTAIGYSESVGEFENFEHFQTAVTTILVDYPSLTFKPPVAVTNPKVFEKLPPPEGPSVHDSLPPDDIKTINKLFASFPPPDPRDVHFAGDTGPSSEEDPVQLPELQTEFNVIRGSGVFKGTLDQFADALSSDSGFEELLSHPQVELLEEKYSPGAKTGRTQTAVPNGPSGEKGPVARAFQQRLSTTPGIIDIPPRQPGETHSQFGSRVHNLIEASMTDNLASEFGSLMDGLSLSELDLLSKCSGISIPQRNGLGESLEDYGNRVRALVELSIQEGVETTPPLTEQEKLLSANLKQKFQPFWDLVVLDPFPLRDPAHRLPVKTGWEFSDETFRVFEIDFDDEPITEEEKSRGFSERGWYFFEAMVAPKVLGPFPSRDVAEQKCREFQNTLDEIATLLGPTFEAIHYAIPYDNENKIPEEKAQQGYSGNGWYFHDGICSKVLGPYETMSAAARELFAYCESLEPKES